VQLLEESYFGIFWHFIGGKSSTRLLDRLFLVNVSEYLQFVFTFNGYSTFTFSFSQDYEIASLKP
jgi:hypothetical protein